MIILSILAWTTLQASPVDTWDALAKEYEQSFERWASELSRTGGFEKPVAERPVSPAVTLRPRFEALSAAGEGRATLWLLQNLSEEPEARVARAAVLFERVRGAGVAPWVGEALHELVQRENAFPRPALAEFARALGAKTDDPGLGSAALLARAALAEDPGEASELSLRAAFLLWNEVALGEDERVAGELIHELDEALFQGLAKQSWFQTSYFPGQDGTYYPRAEFAADPKEVWRPAIDALAARDSVPARLWLLTNIWPQTEAEKASQREHLDAVSRATLSDKDRKLLVWQAGSWAQVLGTEFVEPRVRAIAAGAKDTDQAQMLASLGEGLCEAAADDASRERGLALLREVGTRWPTSEAAQSATAKVFRYTNLLVGKPCPDFETADADGNAFKLSDYKGKVTVIDFWGFW